MPNQNTFFQGTKRGEISEWKAELNSDKADRRKEAVKKVIAAMTVGKDVSILFADVVKCVSTSSIELKKLVYLYIMNYAKTQPELAIMAVNTFVKDATHDNTLIRALAVRTMGCIRVDRITEYLAEPLRQAMRDSEPYVRKTAAVAVAKLFDINNDLVVEQGFIDSLRDLLRDANPMVVANAVAALSEVAEKSSAVPLDLEGDLVNTLLAALNECTEWGQVFILDALVHYRPASGKEAETLCERILPRLSHANSAVVLSAVKVILRNLHVIKSGEQRKVLLGKLAAPLVTLLTSQPEVQYVALRNINIIAQKYPSLLAPQIKVFFCKYNDPIYVKMEKLDIMVQLASERNINNVLSEFKEYATEIDVEFVRRSVGAIGRCAVKLENAGPRCIDVLLELIGTKVNYVVQEAIIVIRDIFRRYPGQYEKIIGTMCENLDTLDEPEAKAAMIWIIGEYAQHIANADELLEMFVDTFHDESTSVQLQLLTAIVKLFLKRPSDTKALLESVLKLCMEETDNPDLRDRGYVYWRLLRSDATAARRVVLSQKPEITDDSSRLEPDLLDQLLLQLSSLASVYHKPPELFVPDYDKEAANMEKQEDEDEDEDEDEEDEDEEDEEEAEDEGGVPQRSGGGGGGGDDVLLDLDDIIGSNTPQQPSQPPQPQSQPPQPAGNDDPFSFDDVLGGGGGGSSSGGGGGMMEPSLPEVLPAAKGHNMLRICGAPVSTDNGLVYRMLLENVSPSSPLSGFGIQFNKNIYGVAPRSTQIPQAGTLSPGDRREVDVPLVAAGKYSGKPSAELQIAVRFVSGQQTVVYFRDQAPLPSVLMPGTAGKLDKGEFIGTWRSLSDSQERSFNVRYLAAGTPEAVQGKLEQNKLHLITRRPVEGKDSLFFSGRTAHDQNAILLEVGIPRGGNNAVVVARAGDQAVLPLVEQSINDILSH